MDFGGMWAAAQSGLPKTLDDALRLLHLILESPWTRALALVVIVYLTIRVIASIYSGDKQGAELGPVAIRQHAAARLTEKTLCLHRDMMPMNMDGVSANVEVLYVYTDADGKRRRHVVHEMDSIQLSISPQKIRKGEKIDGQEIPDVPTAHVCFPVFDSEQPLEAIEPMKGRALDYAQQHKILDRWKDDENIPLISVGKEFLEQIGSGKDVFIRDKVSISEAAQKEQERGGLWPLSWWRRMRFRSIRKKRPNVVGSYYLKFEFSHDPLFVLTRHPDRDLKMTAWLTILTSMFALIMDWWPQGYAPFGFVAPSEIARPAEHAPPPRTARVVVP